MVSYDTRTETLVVDCVLDRSSHRHCLDVALGLGRVVTRHPGECRRLRLRAVMRVGRENEAPTIGGD